MLARNYSEIIISNLDGSIVAERFETFSRVEASETSRAGGGKTFPDYGKKLSFEHNFSDVKFSPFNFNSILAS